MTDPDRATVVFFDGSCLLCRSEIGMYRGADGAATLRLVDISAPEAAVPDGLGREAAMARFHVLSRDGRLLSGAAAFIEVWRQLPGWRWAARLGALPGATCLLETAYRSFLLLRPALVRLFVAARRVSVGLSNPVP
jgi:predicted DCC family thiol-disulfide oxidoreductase YuxK